MIFKCIKLTIITTILSLVFGFVAVAGELDSPSDPNTLSSGMYSLDDIYNRLNSGIAGAITTFNEPTQAPVGQGRNLNDIMSIAPTVDNQLGATPADVEYGKKFWGLKDGTWGLQTGTRINNSSCVPPAYVFNSPSDPINVDGTGQRWCIPGNGTVIDLFTGLVWLRDLSALGSHPWVGCLSSSCVINDANNKTAVGVLAEVENGFPLTINGVATTLSDGSVSGDWRAPTVFEAEFLNAEAITENLSGLVPQPFFSIPIDAWTSSHSPNITSSIAGITNKYFVLGMRLRGTILSSSLNDSSKFVVAVRNRKDTQ